METTVGAAEDAVPGILVVTMRREGREDGGVGGGITCIDEAPAVILLDWMTPNENSRALREAR
jgi:hypothetical protein